MNEPIPAWQPPLREKFVSTDSSNVLIHYFGDVFDWHGYVKFLSLAALRETSQDVPLERLFVQPHVASQHLSPDALEIEPPPPTQPLAAALAEHPRLVLLGDPGSGKSTVVSWICTALGRGMDGPLAKLLGGPLVPLPFILRELGIGQSFAEIKDVQQRWHALLAMFLHRPVSARLREERETHQGDVNSSLVVKLLENGQALVLLDGIDEIGSVELREALRETVHEGMRRYPRARWLLTSRIVGYEEVKFDLERTTLDPRSLKVVQDSEGAPVRSLKTAQVELVEWPEPKGGAAWTAEFVRRNHDAELSASLPCADRLYLAPFNDTQVEIFTRLWWAHHESNPHLAGTKPVKFLRDLRQSHGARSLARLPHLLTMIALIYRVRAELPDGRALLYSFIADAYLGTLDKERGLEHLRPIPHNVEEMSRWLAAVGWELQRRRVTGQDDSARDEKDASATEILLTKDELLQILERAISPKESPDPTQPALTARATAELFLEYAGRRSGLLLPRGEERYAFLHLSFQEYFAALHLRDEVTDPEWWSGKSEPASAGMSLADVRRYSFAPAWRETLVFLWESVSLIAPKLPQRLIAGLCGWKGEPQAWGQFPAPTVERMEDEKQRAAIRVEAKQVILVASLSVDPHVALSAEARHALWERCWDYEVARQNSASESKEWREYVENGIAALLLSRPACLHESARRMAAAAFRPGVASLNLSGCTAFSDLTPLGGFPGLHRLDLRGCTALGDLTPLAGLTSLRTLELSGCTALGDLTPLAGLTSLQWLNLSGCTALGDLTPLAGLPSLQSLDLSGCTALGDLTPLAGLPSLQWLNLSGCTALGDLTPLAGLSSLQGLDLSGCTALGDLTPLAGLSSLQWLNLSGCTALGDLTPLAGLTSLQSLNLSGCTALGDLTPLAGLPSLRSLNLSGCTALGDLTPLAGLTSLQFLWVNGCTAVAEVEIAKLRLALPKAHIYHDRTAS